MILMVNSCLTPARHPCGPESQAGDRSPRVCGIPATGSQQVAAQHGYLLEGPPVLRLMMDSKGGRHVRVERMTMGIRGLRSRGAAIVALALGLGLALSGCMATSQKVELASDSNLTPRDRKLLANPPYAQATIPEPYLRHIVDF